MHMSQGGTSATDEALAVVMDSNGNAVVAGSTEESWFSGSAVGQEDFAAVKLDSDGEVLWSWQVRSRT